MFKTLGDICRKTSLPIAREATIHRLLAPIGTGATPRVLWPVIRLVGFSGTVSCIPTEAIT